MKFQDYLKSREKQELISFLEEHGVDMEGLDLDQLVEEGWLDNAKKGLVGRAKKIGTAAALAAAVPGMMSANYGGQQQQPQPYHFQSQKMMVNKQQDDDERADRSYVSAGGKDYSQTNADVKDFVDQSKTPRHAEVLKKAGLPKNYMPTPVSNFTYGSKVSSVEEISNEAGTVIQGEVKKRFGRDAQVRIISLQNAKTGGAQMLVEIDGTVVATDKQDAIKRVGAIVAQIVKDRGYEMNGFRDMEGNSTEVRPAPRSTIDYAAEAAGQPIRFKVQVQIIVRK